MADSAERKYAEEKQWKDRFQVVIAFMLGIAAVAIAWTSYQSNLLSGDAQKEFAKSAASISESSGWYDEGVQRENHDLNLWVEFAKADRSGDKLMASYIQESLMDDNLYDAVEWYQKAPDEVDSPFLNPKEDKDELSEEVMNSKWLKENPTPYEIPEYEEGDKKYDQSKREKKEGEKLDKWGDDFDAVNVILALALFMFGIATVFDSRKVAYGITFFGLFFLVIGGAQMIMLGYYPG